MPTSTQLDLIIDVDVLTAGTVAEVINAIFETLLFQRNQIPIVYKTYRYYVNKWQEEEETQNIFVTNFPGQRQKNNAKNTQKLISAMKQAIEAIFELKNVKCLRFLFGATAFTPNEAYVIHIPTDSIQNNHCLDHHRISPSNLNQTLLSLLTNENLYTIFSHNLNPTNVYMEFEALEHPLASNIEPVSKCQIFPKDFTALPPSCKQIHLHLQHKRNAELDKQLVCCKEIRIYDDIMKLNLNNNTVKRDGEGIEKKRMLKEPNAEWWESDIVVRGFKDHAVKGFNLWS